MSCWWLYREEALVLFRSFCFLFLQVTRMYVHGEFLTWTSVLWTHNLKFWIDQSWYWICVWRPTYLVSKWSLSLWIYILQRCWAACLALYGINMDHLFIPNGGNVGGYVLLNWTSPTVHLWSLALSLFSLPDMLILTLLECCFLTLFRWHCENHKDELKGYRK